MEVTGPGWTFHNVSNPDIILPSTTPSTFHMDLLDNKLVPDPYYRDNLLQFYKYELEDWVYSTSFKVDDALYNKQQVEMVFEGLDTHADITLNGKPVGSTDNAHRTWIFPVKSLLLQGKSNDLQITFHSAVTHDLAAAKALLDSQGFALPANYSHSRKAAYHYGWDWGPRLVTAGVWKPIHLRAFNYA